MPPFWTHMEFKWELKLQKSKSFLHQLPSTHNSSLKIGFFKGLGFLFFQFIFEWCNGRRHPRVLPHLKGDFKASNTPCMQHYLAVLSHTIFLCCLNIWRGPSCFVIALQHFGEYGRQISSAEWNSSALDSDLKILHPWFVQTEAFSRMYQMPLTLLVNYSVVPPIMYDLFGLIAASNCILGRMTRVNSWKQALIFRPI